MVAHMLRTEAQMDRVHALSRFVFEISSQNYLCRVRPLAFQNLSPRLASKFPSQHPTAFRTSNNVRFLSSPTISDFPNEHNFRRQHDHFQHPFFELG
jgi:hypothetical protein